MPQPSLTKRLLAAFYDGLLIIATLFFATALTMPITKGEVAAENRIYMSIYLLVEIYVFLGWFWTHGGQTLGMRAWKQKLVQIDDQQAVSWKQAFIRFITALPAWLLLLIGLIFWIKPDFAASLTTIPGWAFTVAGFFWVLFNNQNNNWRDKLSGTKIILTDNS